MADTKALCAAISAGAYDKAFNNLYGTADGMLARQRRRYCDALAEFERYYGEGRQVRLYSAPGRTEIGGNHTDHNHGVVMAAGVNLDVIAVVSQNTDGFVRVKSYGFDKQDVVDLATLKPSEEEQGHSAALIRGVAAGIRERGGQIGGFDAYTTSDVLRGSGLSSSAAFEVVMGQAFNMEFNGGRFTPVELAQISQKAENLFFGKPSGLMDQTACAVGSAITIDFADPAQPQVSKVAFDLAAQNHALCITDTKGSHADLTPDYAAIRTEMEAVAGFFGKQVLREVDEAEFFENIAAIREKLGDRAVVRSIHFFADSRRAGQLCEAVKQNRFADFLALIREGGHSSFEYNQNAYSISHPQQQGVPVGLAVSQKVLGSEGAWRLQGGGFAGTIQAFVPLHLLEQYRTAMEKVFGEGSCYVLSVRNYGAVEVTPELA